MKNKGGDGMKGVKHKFRFINFSKIKVQIQVELRDFWIGLFWRTLHQVSPPFYTLHLYICIIPFFPIHLTLLKKEVNYERSKNTR
jgi:hypothetical protein